jgi:hypothetical protein
MSFLRAAAGLALWVGAVAGCGAAADGSPAGTSEESTWTGPTRSVPSSSTDAVRDEANADLPLGAAPDVWTWVGFPDSRCADGSPTGIAVNRHANASHLLLFLQGGGACADAESCWIHPTASNLTGYGVAQLGDEPLLGNPIFERSDDANPFRDATLVFVPYCTGDLHAGTNVATYDVNGVATPTYHYGGRNLDLYLARIAAELPPIDRVWLVGISAGGFGAVINQDFVARALGARTDVIDDSGPSLAGFGFPPTWQVRLPRGCPWCSSGYAALFAYDRLTYPSTRFAFTAFENDTCLPGFFGVDGAVITQWLEQYESALLSVANAESFVALGTGHAVLSSTLDPTATAGLPAWIRQMAEDDPSWSTRTE